MIKTTSTKINICCIAARYYVTLIFIWNHVVTILFLIYALISFDCKLLIILGIFIFLCPSCTAIILAKVMIFLQMQSHL